jgi:hypothetical protein
VYAELRFDASPGAQPGPQIPSVVAALSVKTVPWRM